MENERLIPVTLQAFPDPEYCYRYGECHSYGKWLQSYILRGKLGAVIRFSQMFESNYYRIAINPKFGIAIKEKENSVSAIAAETSAINKGIALLSCPPMAELFNILD